MGEPVRSYQHMGPRTLAIFILGKTKPAILLLFLFGIFLWGKQYIPTEYTGYTGLVVIGALILIALSTIGGFFAGWLEYHHYSLALDVNGFKIKRGFLTQRERSVPYRRIQEVKIHRTPFDQIWGVSTVVIDILGEDDGRPMEEDRLILEAVGQNLASEIRDELLKRAQIEQISMHQATRPPQAGI